MFGDGANPSLLMAAKSKAFVFDGSPVLSSDYELKSDVVVFSSFVKKEFCQQIVEFFKDSPDWNKSVTYGEGPTPEDAKRSPRQSDEISSILFKGADSYVYTIFKEAMAKYREIYAPAEVDILSDEGYSLLRYSPGGEYREHTDRGSNNNRVVSGLIYLNDDYKGGEIHFPRYDLRIKPMTGSVVMFPSTHTHLHAALPVTEGTKYSIVTWFK